MRTSLHQLYTSFRRTQAYCSQRPVLFLTLLISIHVSLLAYAATCHSPTALEPALLTSGISHWEFGRFELYRVNPPLVRMTAAIPLMAVEYRTDWSRFYDTPGSRLEYPMGADFITVNGERSFWLITIARWACIPFSVAGALFCFLWAKKLYKSTASGLLAVTLWCFNPNILAHGELITNDCAAAAFGIGAGYAFWRWLKSATWTNAVFAGVLLCLAVLAKMTWLILFALWPLLAMIWCFAAWKSRARLAFWGQLAVMLAISVYLINLAYFFDGSFTKCGEFSFVSEAFRGHQDDYVGNRMKESWLGSILVPLPKQFVLGLDTQMSDFEHFGRDSYLAGEWQNRGWWYYYLYGLLVKMPHGTQLLLLLVLAAKFRRPFMGDFWNEFILVAPALVVFVIVSTHTAFSHHFRYVIPCFGFGFVFLGQSVNLMGRYGKVCRGLSYVLVICSVSSSLWTYPHLLAYFNEAAGGPRNGHKHMLHSSLDWGQDLLYLKCWLEQHPAVRAPQLAYESDFDASVVGLKFARPPFGPVSQANRTEDQDRVGPLPGWYALSVNHIWDCSPEYHYFQRFQPVISVGYSIYIYHITLDEANQIREELELLKLPKGWHSLVEGLSEQ